MFYEKSSFACLPPHSTRIPCGRVIPTTANAVLIAYADAYLHQDARPCEETQHQSRRYQTYRGDDQGDEEGSIQKGGCHEENRSKGGQTNSRNPHPRVQQRRLLLQDAKAKSEMRPPKAGWAKDRRKSCGIRPPKA